MTATLTGPSGDLSSYSELGDVLAALPVLLRGERRRRQLSIRAAADELGCSASTISRIEAGHDCVLSITIAVLRWIDRDRK
ncbi:helix-turn-helix domain-containing protein [Micromonospora lupini]|uniref:helix-turn-helix domain-containing protein n=1 Tax=Micromonospora lupini TaxID=285679 RepID=UPI00224E7AC1|nr:helix-turn-helix transcriptional regulator [Micromonospora lupini]MCX5066627.1 helix-turn-helix domain-containing protein [Micromonospora lupini]